MPATIPLTETYSLTCWAASASEIVFRSSPSASDAKATNIAGQRMLRDLLIVMPPVRFRRYLSVRGSGKWNPERTTGGTGTPSCTWIIVTFHAPTQLDPFNHDM